MFAFQNTRTSAFSKTQLPPELQRVLSCESLTIFLHNPLLRGKLVLGHLLSAPAGASKRETPTSNLTESTENRYLVKLLSLCIIEDALELE